MSLFNLPPSLELLMEEKGAQLRKSAYAYTFARSHASLSPFGRGKSECLNNSLINIRARFIGFEAHLPFVGKH